MVKIAHRVNTIDLLKKTPLDLGVEIDIRSNGYDLILHHDPFEDGVLFKDWLKYFSHQTIVLNVKEEGLESRVLKLLKENNISDFFFLDQSFPFLLKTALLGETRCAVRVSEYEDIQTALSLSNMIDWVWVDCFTKFPLNAHDANKLIDSGFKLCFVSPELQGRTERSYIAEFQKKIKLLGIKGDAVCTKHTDLWG